MGNIPVLKLQDAARNFKCNDIEWCWDMVSSNVEAVIRGPQGSLYEGGTYHFLVHIPFNYPYKPPTIAIRTKIFHPRLNQESIKRFMDLQLENQWTNNNLLSQALFMIYQEMRQPFNGFPPCDSNSIDVMIRENPE